MTEDTETAPYRIVIAIGEPSHLTVLLALAVPLARGRSGRVAPLYVGADQERPSWLAIPAGMEETVEEPVVVASLDVGRAILGFVRDQQPDLLLLHWRGEPSRGRYLLGRTLDPVIQYAPCDVAVVRAGEDPLAFARCMENLRRVLVPSGGGPNASMALRLSLDLGSDAQVTALRVANYALGRTAISSQWDILNAVLEPFEDRTRLRPRVALASGVVEGILRVASEAYDLVLIGATRERLIDRLLFGNLPQELALKISVPLVIVRRGAPRPVAALRRARWRVLHALPQLAMDERIGVYRQVRRGARTSTDFYVMMILSAGIGSLGLLLNSSAVIIGAMLMAPMMTALLGVGLGVVQGDLGLLRLSLRTFILALLVVLGVGSVIGLVIPDRRITQEMLSRSTPTLLDLAVALVSGAAAAYAVSRRNVASALPGVAIAVALVPPLATVGLSTVAGEGQVALGALLLFLTNFVAIVSAAALIFLWVGFHPGTSQEVRARTFRGGLLGTTAVLIGITIVLGMLTVKSIRRTALHRSVERTLVEGVTAMGEGVTLSDWEVVDAAGGAVHVGFSVQGSREITPEEARDIHARLTRELGRPVSLSLSVIPTQRLEAAGPATLR